jgi:hypothetical protein
MEKNLNLIKFLFLVVYTTASSSQLVPAMVGLFVYKAAALVQVYRDNEDLQLIFPDEGGL